MRNDTDTLNQKQDGAVVIAAKVRREIGEMVFRIMKRRGTTLNDFIVNVCEVIMRYMSPDHNRTPEIERCMSLFEHMVGWRDAVRLSDPTTELEVYKAIYLLSGKNKKGLAAVMVQHPFFGDWKQTENVNTIFEAMVEYLAPERYRRLRALAVDTGAASLLNMLDMLIDERTKEVEFEQMRGEFADNERSEYGRRPNDTPFKRKHRRDMDKMFPSIEFNSES